MSMKFKAAIIVFGVLALSAVVSFFSVVSLAAKADKVFPGVSVRNTYLGNKTKEEALLAVQDYIESWKDKDVTVKFNGGSGHFKLSDIGFQSDPEAILKEAWSVGRQGNVLQQWQERRTVAENGLNLSFKYVISQEKLMTIIDSMTKPVRFAPQDAKLVVTAQDTIQIVESSVGRGLDFKDAYSQVQSIINDDSIPQIELAMVDIPPKQSTQDILNMRVNGILATFTTRFDSKKVNRSFNVKVAAEALDGQIIKPGEEFSFNKVVGPRSEEAGYKDAKIILNNEFVDGLGGGVCQVSSTLYNALLMAGVTITQRSNHSLVVKYVPLGQDAAVAYGFKDLRFKNTLPCSIIMKTSVQGNTLTFRLLGDTSLRRNVNVINSIVKEYPFKMVYKNDPTLPKGKQVMSQRGEKGFRVLSKMVIYSGGKVVETKNLPASHYKPLDQIYLVGTKPVWVSPAAGQKPKTNPAPNEPLSGKPKEATPISGDTGSPEPPAPETTPPADQGGQPNNPAEPVPTLPPDAQI